MNGYLAKRIPASAHDVNQQNGMYPMRIRKRPRRARPQKEKYQQLRLADAFDSIKEK